MHFKTCITTSSRHLRKIIPLKIINSLWISKQLEANGKDRNLSFQKSPPKTICLRIICRPFEPFLKLELLRSWGTKPAVEYSIKYNHCIHFATAFEYLISYQHYNGFRDKFYIFRENWTINILYFSAFLCRTLH